MNKYRLICVFGPSDEMTVEIGRETGSRMLPPFVRKITARQLLSCGMGSVPLVRAIAGAGLGEQPFTFAAAQWGCQFVSNAVSLCPWVYYQTKARGGSLKRLSALPEFSPDLSRASLPVGQIISRELYVTQPATWWKNIQVGFRYESCPLLFPSLYAPVPIKSDFAKWFVRDQAAESESLASLSGRYDAHTASVDFEEAEAAKSLAECMADGWRVYVSNPKSCASQVYAHRTPSGMQWFSTQADEDTDQASDMMLQAFLSGRGYTQLGGRMGLFAHNQQAAVSPTELMPALGLGRDLAKLYAPASLSQQEKARIDHVLATDVEVTLEPYQRHGVEWLAQMRQKGVGCMLADDMGLGKTIQALAYMATLDSQTSHLVICPASLVSNWERELLKVAPALHDRVTITTYDKLRLNPADYAEGSWDTVIIDEAQMVKNDNTQRYKAISALKANQLVMLSGTPIENGVEEIWAQFKLLIPEIDLVRQRMHAQDTTMGPKAQAEIARKFLSPFILRRTKESVLDLPPKREHLVEIVLDEKEQRVYDNLRRMVLRAVSTGLTGRVSSIVLEGLLRMRQACISCNLLPKSLSHINDNDSTKLRKAVEMIIQFSEEGHRTLVFSQFSSALEELEDLLERRAIRHLTLTGQTLNRKKVIDSFKSSPDISAFLISLKAGGVGLNLTEADRVIFLDDWWNPAAEDQASARAHRRGQTRDVEVYRLICRGTVEEKILELQAKKRDISDIFNAVGSPQLTIDEFQALLS